MVHRIKLFISDMDGTLLTPAFQISHANADAIYKLEENGIIFAIATGRIRYDAQSICSKRNINPYIISNNGTCVFDKDGTLLYDVPIPHEDLIKLITFLKDKDICFGLGESDRFITNNIWHSVLDNEEKNLKDQGIHIGKEKYDFVKAELETQHGLEIVNDETEILDKGNSVYSISIVTFDHKKLMEVKQMIESYPHLMVSIAGEHNAEIMVKSGTKGNAVSFLCKHLGIDEKDVAAIGDSMNDVDMLKKVGLSIAMANARQEVKDICNMQTLSSKEDGVASAIDKLLNTIA